MKSDIEQACEVLNNGGTILYPTDTIWGIGCDATSPECVAGVYDIKRRDDSKALIVLMPDMAMVEKYFGAQPKPVMELLTCPDRPTTVILPGAKGLAHNLSAEDGTVGIRITREPFSNALCRAFGKPLVSTSANISGEPSAPTFDLISDSIKEKADYSCTTRRDDRSIHQPSRIVKIDSDGNIIILRP